MATELETLQERIKDMALIDLCLGSDGDGDNAFLYIKVPLNNYGAYKEASNGGEAFDPEQFGEIIAQGKGHPPAKLVQELKEKYEFWDGFEEAMTEFGHEILASKAG
jgi:hypothetical protein